MGKRQAGLPASPRDSVVSASLELGLQVRTIMPGFLCRLWGSSSDPYVGVVRTSLALAIFLALPIHSILENKVKGTD